MIFDDIKVVVTEDYSEEIEHNQQINLTFKIEIEKIGEKQFESNYYYAVNEKQDNWFLIGTTKAPL